MPVGYENPNGDQSQIAPVESLTEEEAGIQKAAGQLYLQVERGRKAEKELEKLKGDCRHRVFRDEAGWVYHERYCVICGAHTDTI